MSGIVWASDSDSEPENDVPQPVPDQERSPEAFDHDFNFHFRDIAPESDMDRRPGAIDTAEGTAFEEEYRSTDGAIVSSEREIAIAALAKLANESTTSYISRPPHSTHGSSPIKASENYHTIQDFVDHRIDPSDPTRVQIRVRWASRYRLGRTGGASRRMRLAHFAPSGGPKADAVVLSILDRTPYTMFSEFFLVVERAPSGTSSVSGG
ncbi:hypothetical protein LCI18_003627 [Fusarium solani-melongenae]|uniref:Uncharacterized protein n=1 Tax=Fusarium solani subsp. cucurbitae TaxID=2747967 RepID=A0ACD3YUX3_FUSSC|nr:hypothetical protein LCI18_003627 [Fusarium solani-melongenae]